MDDRLVKFFAAVRHTFQYLYDKGFVLADEGTEVENFYGSISYMGKNVCIVFSYDLREEVTDCYVGKVHKGKINRYRETGGYWASLFSYLVKKQGFRGKLPIDRDGSRDEFPELLAFRKLLDDKGIKLLADSEDAFH